MGRLVDYEFRAKETCRCRIKDLHPGAGIQGEYFGKISVDDSLWAIILLDDSDIPITFKADGLVLACSSWKSIKRL